MLSEGALRPLRVEQALRLVPELEVLAPLRALLVSTSQPDDARAWASSGPYLTVGKRQLELGELRREVTPLLRRIGEHVSSLYDAVVEALEKEVRGEGADAVRALLRGGEREESVDRCVQALAWYELAVELAEGLHDRGAEIEALLKLGALSEQVARYAEGARAYQRAFALAEAEFDAAGTMRAGQGLGDMALAQGSYAGAESWYARGLSVAEAASDDLRVAELHRDLAEVLRRKGDLEGAAARLRRARQILEPLEQWRELARAWDVEGMLEAQRGGPEGALAAFGEALACIRRLDSEPRLEVSVRIHLAELYLRLERLLEAEDEIRRAEGIAIVHNLEQRLIRVYAMMGRLAGRRGDEAGFVFFEKALELCRASGPNPFLLGEVHLEYGTFRSELGDGEEAVAHLEQARRIFESLGNLPELARVLAVLERFERGNGSGAGGRGGSPS